MADARAAPCLAYAAASLVFRSAVPALSGGGIGPGGHALAWITLAAGCGLVSIAIQACLVLPPVKATAAPGTRLRSLALGQEAICNQVTELCLAVLALEITERIRQGISQLAIPRDGTAAIRVTISIGVAVPSQARRTLDDLLAAADHALYQAKSSGRDRVVIYADTWVPPASRPLPLARTNVLLG